MRKVSDTFRTLLLMTLATLIAFLFLKMSQTITNIAIVYSLFIVIVARVTNGYWYGMFASFIGVIAVNYFFTEPYMVLEFDKNGYPFTFGGMLVIAFITSATTTHLKEQQRVSNEREMILDKLNGVNRKLLLATSIGDIEEIKKQFQKEFEEAAPEFEKLFYGQINMAMERQHILDKQETVMVEAEKEKIRANLLRAISHDLRTPLTTMIGASQMFLMSEEMEEEEKRRLVSSIYDDALWLLNMVENLLMVTRIDRASAKVHKTLEIMEEVISESVQRFTKRYPDITINVNMGENVLSAYMDPILIEQVILNLLENAVKHTGNTDDIWIHVTQENQIISVSVVDQGIGIEEEAIDTLFDGVFNLKSRKADATKGFGIGLSVCKTIIRAHGGDISVRNRANGAEFIFKIPVEDDGTNE